MSGNTFQFNLQSQQYPGIKPDKSTAKKIYYRMSYHKCTNLQQNTSNTVFQQYIKNRTHYGQVVFKNGTRRWVLSIDEGWLLLKNHQCNSANKVRRKVMHISTATEKEFD